MNMTPFHFCLVCLAVLPLIQSSTQSTKAHVRISLARETAAFYGNSHSSTAQTGRGQKRGFDSKMGGFLGGKMFDYFLSRFVKCASAYNCLRSLVF